MKPNSNGSAKMLFASMAVAALVWMGVTAQESVMSQSALDSATSEIVRLNEELSGQNAIAAVSASTQCVPFSVTKLQARNTAELTRFAQALVEMSESGLGTDFQYPTSPITSIAQLSNPIIRMWYHHGILSPGQSYVGMSYYNTKFMNKMNELMCNPRPTIVLGSPYTIAPTGTSNDPMELYQQRGVIEFRWNFYKYNPDISVKLSITKKDSSDPIEVASDIPLSRKTFAWDIPGDLTPGLYKAKIECTDEDVTCSDDTAYYFEVKATPELACTRAADIALTDFTNNTYRSIIWMWQYRNNCSSTGGAQCEAYLSQLQKLIDAMKAMPEYSQYYNGTGIEPVIGANPIYSAQFREVVKRFQDSFDLVPPTDPKYGFAEQKTRAKIEALSCNSN